MALPSKHSHAVKKALPSSDMNTVFAQMDVVATIIFMSGKMQHLFESGYCSKYAKNMVSQVDEAFCFDSVVCGHHVYKTVWTPFSGEIQELPQVFHASGELSETPPGQQWSHDC